MNEMENRHTLTYPLARTHTPHRDCCKFKCDFFFLMATDKGKGEGNRDTYRLLSFMF